MTITAALPHLLILCLNHLCASLCPPPPVPLPGAGELPSSKGNQWFVSGYLIKMKAFSLPPLSVSPYFMFLVVLRIIKGDFPGSPVVQTLCFQCKGLGSIPVQGTKIPHAMRCGPRKKPKRKKVE